MAFFIISIAVSFEDRAQQRDGPSATAPEDRRWKMEPPLLHRRTGDGSKNSRKPNNVNRESVVFQLQPLNSFYGRESGVDTGYIVNVNSIGYQTSFRLGYQ
jgi:hypothetical protein